LSSVEWRLAGTRETRVPARALLFLSPHTVSSHLRHAYAKLGINSRVERVRAAVATDAPRQHTTDGVEVR
jgi:hypothetical protein